LEGGGIVPIIPRRSAHAQKRRPGRIAAVWQGQHPIAVERHCAELEKADQKPCPGTQGEPEEAQRASCRLGKKVKYYLLAL